MAKVTVAATQFACGADSAANIDKAEALVRRARHAGAEIVLLQELFATPYFCKDQKASLFALAQPAEGHPLLARMGRLAAELEVVLPVSFFERANNALLQLGHGIRRRRRGARPLSQVAYPGRSGLSGEVLLQSGRSRLSRCCRTRYAPIGVGICWDQWFPECARALALKGAEILLYPTAIGSEPQDAGIDSSDHWQRVMQGHAGANLMPLVASNRIGTEVGESCSAHLLRLLVHRRATRREAIGSRARRGNRAHRELRPRGDPRHARRLGPVPGPTAGALWPAHDARRDRWRERSRRGPALRVRSSQAGSD